MEIKTSSILIWSVVICIFLGTLVISGGLGTAVPQINLIAKPFVCLNGQLSFQQTSTTPVPGYSSTYYGVDWMCTDSASGSQTPIASFLISAVAGPFYGLLLFLAAWLLFLRNWTAAAQTQKGKPVRNSR